MVEFLETLNFRAYPITFTSDRSEEILESEFDGGEWLILGEKHRFVSDRFVHQHFGSGSESGILLLF